MEAILPRGPVWALGWLLLGASFPKDVLPILGKNGSLREADEFCDSGVKKFRLEPPDRGVLNMRLHAGVGPKFMQAGSTGSQT